MHAQGIDNSRYLFTKRHLCLGAQLRLRAVALHPTERPHALPERCLWQVVEPLWHWDARGCGVKQRGGHVVQWLISTLWIGHIGSGARAHIYMGQPCRRRSCSRGKSPRHSSRAHPTPPGCGLPSQLLGPPTGSAYDMVTIHPGDPPHMHVQCCPG